MNVETFNARYPVGTPVFAYPGFRPEDASDARRLVTRTRTAAQLSASGDPVVWVEGEGSYICLTHVDPVSEDVWEEARTAEVTAGESAPMTAEPKPIDDARLAEIQRHVDATRNWSLGNLMARELLAEVQRLKVERHSTNEVLSDTAEALREMRDRLAEYERPADAYPPALSWAHHMDDEDLIEFLTELTDVMQDARHMTTLAGHVHARRILDGLEKACGTWRLIAEAQHAHNTAPGPDTDQPGMRHAVRTTTPTAEEA